MQEKSLADFTKEPVVSPTAEDLLSDFLSEQPGTPYAHPEPATILVILNSAVPMLLEKSNPPHGP